MAKNIKEKSLEVKISQFYLHYLMLFRYLANSRVDYVTGELSEIGD